MSELNRETQLADTCALSGHGIAVVDLSVIEIPGGDLALRPVVVEPHVDPAAGGINGGDGAQVAVVDSDVQTVLGADDPVASPQ